MIALPVMRGRVAPVLNWCTRMQIFPDGPAPVEGGRELNLPHLEAPQRLQELRAQGVTTLICGAVSADLLQFAQGLGLTVVSGVAGEVQEVVQSFWKKTLDHPKFLLPGCKGPGRYGSGWRRGRGSACERHSGPGRRGPKPAEGSPSLQKGLGPGGFCRCPGCGFNLPHEQGIPCVQIRCPHCGLTMERS